MNEFREAVHGDEAMLTLDLPDEALENAEVRYGRKQAQ